MKQTLQFVIENNHVQAIPSHCSGGKLFKLQYAYKLIEDHTLC